MAYPDFDDPMYEKLRDISSELLLPNLQLIPPDTHDAARDEPAVHRVVPRRAELRVRQGAALARVPDRPARQLLPPVLGRTRHHRRADRSRRRPRSPSWSTTSSRSTSGRRASTLGTHRNSAASAGRPGRADDARRPAQEVPEHADLRAEGAPRPGRARAHPLSDPVVADGRERRRRQREIKFPCFKATVDPDIAFFGFDLTVEQARGADNPQTATDDWGWYFVIQQLPGEPRFGMDVELLARRRSRRRRSPGTTSRGRSSAGEPSFIDTGVPPQGVRRPPARARASRSGARTRRAWRRSSSSGR